MFIYILATFRLLYSILKINNSNDYYSNKQYNKNKIVMSLGDFEYEIERLYNESMRQDAGNTSILVNKNRANARDVLPLRRLNISLDKVVSKPSPIHGRGVFAKTRILKGELITLYPCHVLQITQDANENESSPLSWTVYSESVDSKFGTSYQVDCESLGDYELMGTPNYRFFGHPMIDINPAYLGHLINDAVKPTDNLTSQLLYTMKSQTMMNCCIHSWNNIFFAIVACRDIDVGEEFLLSYGLAYWTTRCKANKDVN